MKSTPPFPARDPSRWAWAWRAWAPACSPWARASARPPRRADAPSAGGCWPRLDEAGPLELGVGRRLRLPPTQGRPLRLSGDVQLEAGEVLRIDLVQQLPGEADLFQVDRASVYAADSIDPASTRAEGPQSFDGLSVLLSARPGLPSEILRAEEFKVDRSAGAWTLDPGTHHIDISVDLPFVTVAVDGRIREIRGDLAGLFHSGAWGRDSRPPRARKGCCCKRGRTG